MKTNQFSTIWQSPKYLPYVQPALTDEILKDAEEKLGHKIPQEYIELLKIQNGGYIRFTLEETANEKFYGIGPYYPSLTEIDWTDYEDDVSYNLNDLIPFDSDGHLFLCFDYRNGLTTPKITLLDTECDTESEIATDFTEYLKLLEIDTENEYVISSEETLNEVVKKIGNILDINFELGDKDANGYLYFMGKYKKNVIFISPNKVPNAFIREDEERYEDLKSLMETDTLRFPELSDQSVLITVYEENQKKVLNELIKNDINIKSLKECL